MKERLLVLTFFVPFFVSADWPTYEFFLFFEPNFQNLTLFCQANRKTHFSWRAHSETLKIWRNKLQHTSSRRKTAAQNLQIDEAYFRICHCQRKILKSFFCRGKYVSIEIVSRTDGLSLGNRRVLRSTRYNGFVASVRNLQVQIKCYCILKGLKLQPIQMWSNKWMTLFMLP